MSKSDPHARDHSSDPVYNYQPLPGMPQYKTAPPGTPSQLQTGGWAGGLVKGMASTVGSVFHPGGGGSKAAPRNTVGAGGKPVLPSTGGGFVSLGATPSAGSGTGGGLPSTPLTHAPKRSGIAATETNGGRAAINSTPRTTAWGGLASGAAGGIGANWYKLPEAVGMANSTRNASGGTTTRFRPGEAAPVTKRNQARADSAAAVTAANAPAKGDLYNWGGIAKDLGNAGDKRWAVHKTGALPSTGANKFVAANPAFSTPKQVAQARLSAGIKDRPVTNAGGWSRLEGGPRAKAAAARWTNPNSNKGPR